MEGVSQRLHRHRGRKKDSEGGSCSPLFRSTAFRGVLRGIF